MSSRIIGSMATTARRERTAAHEAQKLFFEIGMAQRSLAAAALAELGLTFAQAHALRLLDPERSLPMSAVAERLFCDASNVTGIADRLEARGLIERRAAEGDRRVKVLALTPPRPGLRRPLPEGPARLEGPLPVHAVLAEPVPVALDHARAAAVAVRALTAGIEDVARVRVPDAV